MIPRTLRRGVAGLVGVAVVAGAVALSVVAVPLASYEKIASNAETVAAATVSVVSRPTDLPVNASADLVWSSPQVVRSSSAGVVSAVFAAPRVEVGCGVAVFEVDSFPVVSYCGPRPLTGAVSATSKGRDTDDFVAWLRSVGFFEGVAAPSAAQRRDAIRFWQASLGMAVDATVEPGELVWLTEPFTPTAVSVEPGVPIAPGDTVMSVAERLTSATVNVTAPVADESAGGADEAPMVFGVDTNPARVSVDADGAIGDVGSLESMLRETGLLADGLPASAAGSVRLAEPVQLATVPASSIITGGSGTCVIAVDGDARSVVPVTVLSSSVGTVFVDGELSDGTLVSVDPDRATPC
jgi:hypothetical protein